MWLKVWDRNVKAIRFYDGQGFKSLGSVEYVEGGMDDRVLIIGRSIGAVEREAIRFLEGPIGDESIADQV